MLKLASDADVHGHIIRGLRRREPGIDLVRVQDVGLRTAADDAILTWAASEGRVLVTRDRKTMIGHAHACVLAGRPVPGLIAIRRGLSIGDAIDDILIVAECMSAEEIAARVVIYLPM